MLHLSLLHERLVGTLMALIVIICLLVQELFKPSKCSVRIGLWVVIAVATAVFVSALLKVQHSVK